MYNCPKCNAEVKYLYYRGVDPINDDKWLCVDCAVYKQWKKCKLKRHPLAISVH